MDVRTGLSLAILALAACPALAQPTRKIVILNEDEAPPHRIINVSAEEPPIRRVIELIEDEPTSKRVIDLDTDKTIDPPVDRLPDTDKPVLDVLADDVETGFALPRLWIEGGYLGWTVKNGPLKIPLITTGNPGDGPAAGALGQPGTRILFGGTDLDYGRTTGARVTVGTWLGEGAVGLEATAFWLDSRDVSIGTTSNGIGVPSLYLPSFNVVTGNEARLAVADPLAGFTGNVAVHSQSRLWGWDANALFAVARGTSEVTLLAGFRYADLTESLSIQNTTNDLFFLTQSTLLDRFDTSNHFYGGQVGVRANTSYGRWTAGLTAKLALGATFQTIDISGTTRQSVPPTTFAGGFFAQPSNIGRRSVNDFSAIPELNLRAGCQVTNYLKAFVGYDVMWWSQVARPGDQIDRGTNPSQSPVFGVGSLTGSARPAWLTNASGFYAQGFTAGLEFRY